MAQIPSKIYYSTSTGEILVITAEYEREGATDITKEEDMKIYPQLQDKNSNDVDYIKLNYGELTSRMTNAKSYKINLETKQLEVTYYTQEELDTMEQQNQEAEDLNFRVSDISTYLNNNQMTIADVEDLILQSEQNKILNSEGMM